MADANASAGSLAGRVALVTGGSKGIGRAAALRLAADGADVVVAAREAGPAAEVVQAIEAMGRRAVFLPVDLVEYDSVEKMVGQAIDRFGRLDVLVASGAGGRYAARPFVEIDPRSFPDCYASIVYPRLHPVAAALPHMQAQQYGKIVVITTDAGRMPTPAQSIIGGAAAGLIFTVRALGRELARFGVRINAVSLSLTRDTPAYERFAETRDSGEVLAKAFAKIEKQAPFGLNSPQDAAEAIWFFASPRSDQISGATLSVNGGISFPG